MRAILENGWVYFCRGCAVSLTNPKVILFFVAFFPLFLAPDSARVPLVALMVHVTLISFLYQTGLVLIGNSISQNSQSSPRWVDRDAGRWSGVDRFWNPPGTELSMTPGSGESRVLLHDSTFNVRVGCPPTLQRSFGFMRMPCLALGWGKRNSMVEAALQKAIRHHFSSSGWGVCSNY